MRELIRMVRTQEYRKIHRLPNRKVRTEDVHIKDPRFSEFCRQHWWYSEYLINGNSRVEFINKTLEGEVEYNKFRELFAVLTSIGGHECIFCFHEPDLEAILKYGVFTQDVLN